MVAPASKSVNIAIMTVSDTRTEADDKSGNTLVDRAKEAGHSVVAKQIVKDEIEADSNFIKQLLN